MPSVTNPRGGKHPLAPLGAFQSKNETHGFSMLQKYINKLLYRHSTSPHPSPILFIYLLPEESWGGRVSPTPLPVGSISAPYKTSVRAVTHFTLGLSLQLIYSPMWSGWCCCRKSTLSVSSAAAWVCISGCFVSDQDPGMKDNNKT